MEAVRAAQQARLAKLAAPAIGIFDDAPGDGSDDEPDGAQSPDAPSWYPEREQSAPPPVAPPAVDLGMKEVMEAKRRRQVRDEGAATPAGIVMRSVHDDATERLLHDLMSSANVRAAAGIHGDRNGLIAADSAEARDSWITVVEQMHHVLDLASEAAEADDAVCIAQGQYDDLRQQYEMMREDLCDNEREELEEELAELHGSVLHPAGDGPPPNALLLNALLVWQQAIAAMGSLEEEGTACAPCVFKLFKLIQTLYGRAQALSEQAAAAAAASG